MRIFPNILFLCFMLLVSVAKADEKLPFPIPRDVNTLPQTALIQTSKGPFEVRFFRDEAPISVANFVHLGRKGTYKNVSFHRYVKGFIIQGGDPTGTTKGGPGWTLPAEMSSKIRVTTGAVGWARLPEGVNPERRSNGSQFFITLAPQPSLDGFYTIFAEVIRGMETVQQLREGDLILDVRFPKPGSVSPALSHPKYLDIDPWSIDDPTAGN